MSNRKIIMGVDTSNYTTSVALTYSDGELIANFKLPLPVKSGERGLRQSDAVFAHVKNLPRLMEAVRAELCGRTPAVIGVSERPRNVEGSYMPCFLSGVAAAESISASLGIPIYRFSHQCGHVMAAVYSSGRSELLSSDFLAFHLSGGTTELLRVRYDRLGFHSEIVGGTLDLNAGQIVDRIGVRMGLAFPAGAELEGLALKYNEKIKAPRASVKGGFVNLSGLENRAVKLLDEGNSPEYVSAFTLYSLLGAITAVCDAALDGCGSMPIAFAGGVMSNSILKRELAARYDACFAEPRMSSDNAVGIAELTRRAHLNI